MLLFIFREIKNTWNTTQMLRGIHVFDHVCKLIVCEFSNFQILSMYADSFFLCLSKICCSNEIRGINLIKLEEANSIMKYHKNNILLSSKYLLQSLKLNFQKDQYQFLKNQFNCTIPSPLSVTFIKTNFRKTFSLPYSFTFSKNAYTQKQKITILILSTSFKPVYSCKNIRKREKGMERNGQRCERALPSSWAL